VIFSNTGGILQDYDITLNFLSGEFPQHFVDLIFNEFSGEVISLDKELPSGKRETDYLVKIRDEGISKDMDSRKLN